MKKLILAVAIAAIFAMSSVVYAGQFGPPEPVAKEGKAALGIGYFYYSAKWKPEDSGWDEGKITQNRVYLQLGYGFTENWEAYIMVGGADIKSKKAFLLNDADFKQDLKPFGTIGIKGVFNVTPSFGIGPFLQASLGSSYTDKESFSVTLPAPLTIFGTTLPAGTYTVTETLKYKNLSEINLGVGFQGKIEGAFLYGGPVVYWSRAKVNWTIGVTGPLTDSISDSTTYKEKNNIGGFAGIRWPLGEGLSLEVEGQVKSRFSIGGALTYSF